MRVNPLHWIAVGVTVALMFAWQMTPLGVLAHNVFVRFGLDGGWAWPVCGLVAFWVTYLALKFIGDLRRRRRKTLDVYCLASL